MSGWWAPLWLPALCAAALLLVAAFAARDVARARRDRRTENR